MFLAPCSETVSGGAWVIIGGTRNELGFAVCETKALTSVLSLQPPHHILYPTELKNKFDLYVFKQYKGFKLFHAFNYHVPVCFNFSEYGFHFPHTILPSRNGFIIIWNANIMIFHNIVTKVELFRNLLIFRGDKQDFFSLKKKAQLVFQHNGRYTIIYNGETSLYSGKRFLQLENKKRLMLLKSSESIL